MDTPPVDCDHWNPPLSRGHRDRYSDPWAIRWYGEQDPVELALPLWPYPSMFYYGAGE